MANSAPEARGAAGRYVGLVPVPPGKTDRSTSTSRGRSTNVSAAAWAATVLKFVQGSEGFTFQKRMKMLPSGKRHPDAGRAANTPTPIRAARGAV